MRSVKRYVQHPAFVKLYSRNSTLFITENFIFNSISELIKYTGSTRFSQLGVSVNEFTEHFGHTQELASAKNNLRTRVLRARSIRDYYEGHALPVFDRYEKFTQWMGKKYATDGDYGAKMLTADFQRFIKINGWFVSKVFFIFFTDMVIDDAVGHRLQTHFEKRKRTAEQTEIMAIISSPLKMTAVVRERYEFLRLALSNQDSKRKLLRHWQKWNWFPCYNPSDLPYSLHYYRQQLKKISRVQAVREISAIVRRRRAQRTQMQRLLSSVKDSQLRKLLMLTNMIAYYRERRNDVRRKGLRDVAPLFRAIARRLHLTLKAVCYLTQQEVIAALRTPNAHLSQITRRRMRGYVLLSNPYLLLDHPAAVRKTMELIRHRLRHDGELRGLVAQGGKVQGSVVVISHIRKLKEVKDGDILVASMTAPEYVPAMKRAAAIVTDEGGITCHAAIVARELRKTCIVGTKIATKVFKDGDRVEVNANQGIVRKI